MGIKGEAVYLWSTRFAFFHYALLGLILAVVDRVHRLRPSVATALAAGSAIRIAKGGLIPGLANLVLLWIPLVVFAIACAWLSATSGRKSPQAQELGEAR